MNNRRIKNTSRWIQQKVGSFIDPKQKRHALVGTPEIWRMVRDFQIKFLKESSEVQLISFNEQPIGIELPPKMTFKVTAAPAGTKGDSAQGRVTKTAVIETGYPVAVPLFVKEGDIIRVNTGEYVERVN